MESGKSRKFRIQKNQKILKKSIPKKIETKKNWNFENLENSKSRKFRKSKKKS